MNYATKEQLAEWLGYETAEGTPDVSQLPDKVNKIIKDASRVIDHATMGQFDTSNEKHTNVLMLATCAQCEYFIDGPGAEIDIFGDVAGVDAGKVSVKYKGGVLNAKIQKLAPRARRELWLGGLLNRRVNSL